MKALQNNAAHARVDIWLHKKEV